MLRRYRETIDSFSPETRRVVAAYFRLRRPDRTLYETLQIAGLWQADLVLCLLRTGCLRDAEALVGRPISRCPPQLSPHRAYRPPATVPRTGDERLVTRWQPGTVTLGGNRCLLATPMYDRFSAIKHGMSVTQLVSRGVTRRDLRIVLRRGWLELEDAR